MPDATTCPIYKTTPDDKKPAFKDGYACGYDQGMNTALDVTYLNKRAADQAKRLIPIYAGAGFIVGVLGMLFFLSH